MSHVFLFTLPFLKHIVIEKRFIEYEKEENRENDENLILVLKTTTSNCGDRIDRLLEHPKFARHQILRIYTERMNTTKY